MLLRVHELSADEVIDSTRTKGLAKEDVPKNTREIKSNDYA